MKLEKIDFILENCEVISIDGKYVNTFLVDDIIYYSPPPNSYTPEIFYAGVFFVGIHKDANEEYCIHNLKNCEMLIFKRLIAFPDICQIKIVFDTQEYCYWLSWNNELSDCYNSYQSCYLTDEGHLYISVAKDKTIYDFFSQDCLLDNEAINDSFSPL